MRRSTLLLLVALLLLIAGCNDDGNGQPTTDASPTSSPAAKKVPKEVEGKVLDADGSTSFNIRSGNKTYTIFVDSSIDYGFPLSHLRERLVGAGRFLVITEERDGRPVAVEIRDL